MATNECDLSLMSQESSLRTHAFCGRGNPELSPGSPRLARHATLAEPRNDLSGFTLLEILLALFIFTIVALILSKSLHTVISSQAATEKAAERLTQTQMALLFLSRDLEQALDRPVSDPEGRPEGAFIGNRSSLRFTHGGFANPGGGLQSSTLQRSAYRFEKGQFIRATWDALDQAPHALPHNKLLLSEIQDLSFRYLDNKQVFHSFWPLDESENAKAPSRAQPNSGSAATLPRAIELNLTFVHGGHLRQIYPLPQQEVPHAAF